MFLHKLLALLVLATAANLDNLGVGIAYGMARNRISGFSNFLIALFSAILTFVAMMFGKWVEHILPASFANELGAIVIVGVGIWVYWESAVDRFLFLVRSWLMGFLASLTKFSNLPPVGQKTYTHHTVTRGNIGLETYRRQHSRSISFKETLILGVSLALNAMAGGFGASLSNYDPVITSVAIGVFSYLTIDIGQRVSGKVISKSLGSLSQKAAGLLLILIGVYELFF